MKRRNVSAGHSRTLPGCLPLLPDKPVSGQGTTIVTPDARQDPGRLRTSTGPSYGAACRHPAACADDRKDGERAGQGDKQPRRNPLQKRDAVTLYAVPDANSIFTGWSGNCSGSLRTCSVNMTADRAVTASFSLRTYTIRISSPVNGVIHPSGTIRVTHGEKRRFQVIPLPGYRVSVVLVDKVSVGPVNSYTFNNVTDDHVMEAIFVQQ